MRLFLIFIPILIWADAHIFVYHRFDDNRYKSTDTSSKTLIRQLNYLKTHNYKVVKLSTLVKMIKNRENIDKVVALTIDDSFKSFYTNAFPLFKKYNYPFNLYVYVKATDKHYGDYMSWKEIKEISKYGEIGLHSYAHPHLTKLSNREIEYDTKKAYNIFIKKLHFKPKGYAYPYGEYNQRVKKIIESFKFDYILNQNAGAIRLNTPISDLDRIALTGDVNIAKKLKIKRLNLKNFKVVKKNNIITEIYAETNLKRVEIYITNYGWKYVNVKNNILDFKPNFKLKKFRNRVIIRYNNSIISKMITKGE